MTANQRFTEGIKFISIIYGDRLNGQAFNRCKVKAVISMLSKLGFTHQRNVGQLVELQCIKDNKVHTVHVGKEGDFSLYSLYIEETRNISA